MPRPGLTLFAALLAVASAATPGLAQYRIRMSAAITGPASSTYAPTYEAYKAYFRRINDAGGINGQKVEIAYEDDRGEPQRAAANAKKLAEGSILMVNASTSATYKPFMTESETEKIPLLFGGGVCPREAFPPANPLIFCSTSFGSKWDSRFALGFIKQQAGGKKVKVGFAAQDIPLSRIELGVFEALQRIGWQGSYLLYGHQQTQDELERLKAGNLYAFGGNTLFMENLPIHSEINNVKGQTTHPAHYMAEGWVSAMVLEASLRKCGWPCPKDKLATAMAGVSVDTRGLRGGPIEWTADNHYRKNTYYKVYRWDPAKTGIASVGGWTRLEIK